MKYFTAILLSAFLACSLSAQSSSKRDILPAQRKAELKENFQKSLVKNDFGDIAIPVPKPDIDSSYEFEWMFGHPYHFLQFFDSDINGELLRKLTSDESYLQKASFKGNRAMSTIECYLKEWRLRLKKGSFKPSEIKRRLDEGQPMFAYLSLRSGELKETAARLRERSKSASAKDWQKALEKYELLKPARRKGTSTHSFIVGYNEATSEYRIFHGGDIYWLREQELKESLSEIFYVDL